MNWAAIVIATLVNAFIGAIWFSRTGRRIDGSLVALTTVSALISSYTLAYLFIQTGTQTADRGALLGAYAGIGLAAPAILVDHLLNNRRYSLYLIVAGYPVVGLIVSGALIGGIRF